VLSVSSDVDGVLSGSVTQAAAARPVAGRTLAEPRVLAWDVDFGSAARFGTAGGPSGLPGTNPPAGHVVLNRSLASSLSASAGDRVSLFLGGAPREFVVSRVIPNSGLGGTGFGSTVNRNAFLPPGTLRALPPSQVRQVTWVSNRGGVESGDALSGGVAAQIRRALGVLGGHVAVETPKHEVLRSAKKTGDALGALFLMIGSFSIIAGALPGRAGCGNTTSSRSSSSRSSWCRR
jgi:putative ABC transport system permease protein